MDDRPLCGAWVERRLLAGTCLTPEIAEYPLSLLMATFKHHCSVIVFAALTRAPGWDDRRAGNTQSLYLNMAHQALCRAGGLGVR